MIDLHIHTIHSDGLKSPLEVINKANELGLNAISFTDHNTVEAYKNIDEYNKIYNGIIIRGCELTCMLDKLCIELLAYNYDIEKLDGFIKKSYLPFPKMNILETNLVIDVLLKTPLIINAEDIKYDVENEYGNRGVHREIVKHIENKNYIDDLAWNDPHEFSVRYLSNEQSPYYVDYSSLVPNYLDVVKAIKDSNGLVFMPHIYKYKDSLNEIFEYIINKKCLDGIECYHSSFSEEDVINAKKIANDYGLFMSGGTDTHGYDEEDEVKLGIGYGNMSIPDQIAEPWILKKTRK